MLLFAVPLAIGSFFAQYHLFIDDAYITFRYAENIAAGQGFTYNPGERVMGTTTPLYCLWLSLWNMTGVSTPFIALVTGILAVSASGLLLWRIGKINDLSVAGAAAAFMLVLFPRFWEHMISGMETTLASALCLLVIWLDYKKKPALCGLASACLVLTRPDAGTLVAAVMLVRFLLDRKAALISAAFAILGLIPWMAFGFLYFGDPLPSSLAVKRLIHPFPWYLVLKKYLSWFVTEPSLIALSILWLVGAFFIIRRRRELLALVLWPIFFIAGMAALEIGPFFWYKVPLFSGYFLVAALGAWYIFDSLVPAEKMKWKSRAFTMLIALITAGSLAILPFRIKEGNGFLNDIKEKVYKEIAEVILKRGERGDRVYVGDVGVLGYYLRDFYIIDSAGLNSPEVYRLRLEDRKLLLEKDPMYRYDWWGSPDWSRRLIRQMQPDFITSDINYLHLRTLMYEDWFQEEYEHVRDWSLKGFHGTSYYLLFERKKE